MKTTMAFASYLVMLSSTTEARRLGQEPREVVCEGMRVECDDSPEKLFICHNKEKTLCLPESAVPAHLDHGDTCGVCRPDDEKMPCVAVIDEDSSFRSRTESGASQATTWDAFRAQYPNRPFCLLAVKDERFGGVHPPEAFLEDGKAIYKENINRDEGNVNLAEDWVELCELTDFSPTEGGYVGLFVDISSSMYLSTVQASYDKFQNAITARGIELREDMNPNENWILPFSTILGPNAALPA